MADHSLVSPFVFYFICTDQNYEKSLMEHVSLMPIISPDAFIQWSADNVDHNCRTIYGKSTFHVMGIIASVTPSISSQAIAVDRHTIETNMKDITTTKSLPITEYIGTPLHHHSMKFKSYGVLKEIAHIKKDKFSTLDFYLANKFDE